MKITLHVDKCIGCGTCAVVAPDIFTVDTGTVSLKKEPETFTDEDKKKAKEAANMCPVEAIEVTE